MTAAVTTVDLNRRFGERIAVSGMTLTVDTGDVVGLIGPNGAGKTTLIRLLCGLVAPSSGSAVVLGRDVTHASRSIRQRIGYMAQGFSLYREMTVEENLAFYARVYGIRGRAAGADACARAGIDARDRAARVETLPTGTRQRVALAVAIQHRPQLVFLDEPTSGVDPVGSAAIWDVITDLARSDVTVVVTTHRLSEAARCERVALMHEGRLLAIDSPDALVAAVPAVPVRIETPNWQEAYRLARRRWARVGLEGRRVRILMPQAGGDFEAEVRDAMAGLPIDAIRRVAPTLDDAFATLIAPLLSDPTGWV